MNRKAIEKRFALVRCKPNKKTPATKHGYYDAQRNMRIEELCKNNFNVAISCRMSGVIVFDLDVDLKRGLNGIETKLNLEKELGVLPLTLTQTTPRNGLHLIYSDEGIVNPKGKIGNDFDIKWNGQILCEPSTINGKCYKFTKGIDENGNLTIAKLPTAWIDYINKPTKNKTISQEKNYVYQRRIIDGDFQKMYDKCAFVKHCVDNAETLAEPLWYLFACVLNSLSNGKELFDYYSQPYPNYNSSLTKAKFQNASKYNVNCNTISGHFADCAKCQYKKGK